MPDDTARLFAARRYEAITRIETISTLREAGTILGDAIRECLRDGYDPEEDPAVSLIAGRIGEIAEASADERARALRDCRAALARHATKPPLLRVMSEAVSSDPERKVAFHALGKELLTELAHALGFRSGSFDIRSNMGGPAVSGEIVLHADRLYVQLGQGAIAGHEILFRSCQGRRDYTGGPNHFAGAAALADPAALARKIGRTLGLPVPDLPIETPPAA